MSGFVINLTCSLHGAKLVAIKHLLLVTFTSLFIQYKSVQANFIHQNVLAD